MIPLEIPIKSTVVRINAAQAFILITEHKGNTNLEIVGWICKFSSATSIVIGNVAAEDLEKNAVTRGRDIRLNVCTGERPFALRKRGRTTSP